MPGVPQRRSCDYRRCGTTNLYAALDTASGKVITAMTARHRSEEFRKFLNLIDKQVPQDQPLSLGTYIDVTQAANGDWGSDDIWVTYPDPIPPLRLNVITDGGGDWIVTFTQTALA